MSDEKRTSSGRTAQRWNNMLPAGRLDGGWAIELAFAEQGKDQSHQFAGGEHQSSFVFVFGDLLVFRIVEGAVSGVVHSDRISGLHEVVAQVGIGRAQQSSILRIEVGALMTGPDQAGHLG